MKSINDIAAAAYHAHAKELARLICAKARPWNELPSSEVKCWEQAALQVLAEATAMGVRVEGVAVDITSDDVAEKGEKSAGVEA